MVYFILRNTINKVWFLVEYEYKGDYVICNQNHFRQSKSDPR